jgi:putative sigma-54 modulation protein
MRLELTGKQIDITTGVRRIIETKLAKLERILNDSAVSAQVVVSREKIGHRADVTLHARGERFLHGQGRGESLGTAMGEAVEKLGQQVRTLKGKFEGRKRGGSRELAEPVEAAPVAAPPAGSRRPRAKMPRILKARRQTIRTLSVSDAAAKVDGGEDAIVFLDAETSKIAVLYRSPGGELTLIETTA